MLSPDRKNYITASVAGAILGRGKFKSRTDILRQKVSALLGEEAEQETNEAMSYGNRNEHEGVAYAMQFLPFEHTGDDQMFFTKGIFGATPDGVYVNPVTGKRTLLEVKMPFKQFYTADEIMMVMPEYYDQIQIAMHAADADETMFVVRDPDGNYTHHFYERSDDWFAMHEKELNAFWQSVLDSVAYAKDEKQGIDKTMVELSRQIKALEELLDGHKAALKKKYKAGVLLGKVLVTTETRAGAVDWEAAFAEHGIDKFKYQKPSTKVTKVIIDTKE